MSGGASTDDNDDGRGVESDYLLESLKAFVQDIDETWNKEWSSFLAEAKNESKNPEIIEIIESMESSETNSNLIVKPPTNEQKKEDKKDIKYGGKTKSKLLASNDYFEPTSIHNKCISQQSAEYKKLIDRTLEKWQLYLQKTKRVNIHQVFDRSKSMELDSTAASTSVSLSSSKIPSDVTNNVVGAKSEEDESEYYNRKLSPLEKSHSSSFPIYSTGLVENEHHDTSKKWTALKTFSAIIPTLMFPITLALIVLFIESEKGSKQLELVLSRDSLSENLMMPHRPIVNELRYDELLLFLQHEEHHVSWYDLETPGTPQNRALWWLADADPAQLHIPDIMDGAINSLSSLQLLQRYALAVFYYSTFYPNSSDSENFIETSWKNYTNWMTGKSICLWHGVLCNHDKTIGIFNLTQNNLNGTIPSELKILGDSLHVLDFQDNKLHGTIPSGILSSMTQLTWLALGQNDLRGTIPTEISSISKLQLLDISNNQFTGTIPRELVQLSRLQVFQLKNCMFLYLRGEEFADKYLCNNNPPPIIIDVDCQDILNSDFA